MALVVWLISPAAQTIPDNCAGNGDSGGLDDVHVSIGEEIPGNNPDENAKAFGNRECRMWGWHRIQSLIFPWRDVDSALDSRNRLN